MINKIIQEFTGLVQNVVGILLDVLITELATWAGVTVWFNGLLPNPNLFARLIIPRWMKSIDIKIESSNSKPLATLAEIAEAKVHPLP